MWYPPKEQTIELDARLSELSELPEAEVGAPMEFLTRVSAAVWNLAAKSNVPASQIRDWIWIGSRYRLSVGSDNRVQCVARAALAYLCEAIHGDQLSTVAFARETNWIVDNTVSELLGLLGARARNRFLSEDEESQVAIRLGELAEAGGALSPDEVARIDQYLGMLEDVSSEVYLPGIAHMVRLIRSHYDKNGQSRVVAMACLRYVAEEYDVVPDSLGYLGLVDDIYSIEVTYRQIEHAGTFGPLVDWLGEQQQDLHRLSFEDPARVVGFDRFMQAIFGLALEPRVAVRNKKCIVVPETSVCGLIAAFMGAVASIRSLQESEADPRELREGDDILLGDADVLIKAQYGGALEREGTKYKTIILRDGRRIVDDRIVGSARLAGKPHARLSSEQEFQSWKQSHSPSPLIHLIGGEAVTSGVRPTVLLLTRRNRLEELAASVRPMGSTVSGLVGIKYIASTGTETLISDTRVADPLIVACSDAQTAIDILGSSDDPFSPQYVVVDDGELAANLCSLLAPDMLAEDTQLIVFPALHESEAVKELMARQFDTWLIRRGDVDPIPYDAGDGAVRGPVSGFQARQAIAADVRISMHEANCDPIEFIFEYLRDLRRKAKEQDSTEHELVAIALSAFIRRYTSNPIPFIDSEVEAMNLQLARVSYHCGILADYEPEIRDLMVQVRELLDGGIPENPRPASIAALISESEADEPTVLCTSGSVAAMAAEAAVDHPPLARANWVSLPQLRSLAPVEHLIVSGWIGRKQMREIRNCGYSPKVDFLLYGFEREWETMSRRASASIERRIQARMNTQWDGLYRTINDGQTPEPLFSSEPREENVPPDEEDIAGSEFQDDRIVETIRTHSAANDSSEDLTQARLVVFEDPGTYVYLPPFGQVISLSRVMEATLGKTEDELEQSSDTQAEHLVSCPVSEIRPGDVLAFPEGDNLDLLQYLADKFLADAENTRRLAGLWRTALHMHCLIDGRTPSQIQRDLEGAGLKRHRLTIRGWLLNDNTVAPQGYRDAIPVIAGVTGDEELHSRLDDVFASIDLVYRARVRAARELLRQVARQQIKVDEGSASVELAGREIQYRILRAVSIDPPTAISSEQVGVLRNIAQVQPSFDALLETIQ